jgi:tetratricopeptide (TPR) repeat protein
MAGHFREAAESSLKWYDGAFDKAGLIGFFWTDLLVSLHLLDEHETELEHARTARQYNPSSQGAFTFEARALAALGRVDDLRELLGEAETHASDFSVGYVIREAGLELRVHGQPDLGDELIAESVSWYEETGSSGSGYAWSLFALGRFQEARDICESRLVESPDDDTYLGILGSAAAALGDSETALAMEARLAELEARPYVFGGPARWQATIAAQLGDQDRAVELLREAYGHGASYGAWLHNVPQFDGLRGYPPFERFIAPKH